MFVLVLEAARPERDQLDLRLLEVAPGSLVVELRGSATAQVKLAFIAEQEENTTCLSEGSFARC
jgi:hypothetical protein